MPNWLNRLWPIVLFWVFIWLVVTQIGESFHPLLEPREEQTAAQQNNQQQTVDATRGEGSEDRLADYTFWLTIFTGALGIATIGLGVFNYLLWRETRDGGKLARVAHFAEQRPWVNVGVTQVEQVFEDSNWLRLNVSRRITNSGRTPAIDARLYYRVIRPTFYGSDQARFTDFVADSLSAYETDTKPPLIIFPNTIDNDDVDSVDEDVDEGNMPDETAGTYRVFMCVCYRSTVPGSGIPYTALGYQVDTERANLLEGGSALFTPANAPRPFRRIGFHSVR